MSIQRLAMRAIRFLIGLVVAREKTIDRAKQLLLIKRGKRFFAENGIEARIQGLQDDAFGPRYDDLIRLWDLVRTNRPSFILEYGSGCSTLVMAAALLENRKEGKGNGKMLSIEGYEKWRAHTESHLTEAEREFVELRKMQPEVVCKCLKINKDGKVIWYGVQDGVDIKTGIVGLVYPELHNLSPDMIYLDGPDPNSVAGYADPEGMVYPAMVFDALEMEDHLPPNTTIVVDGRAPNTLVLYNNFKACWETEILTRQKCTVLRRKLAS